MFNNVSWKEFALVMAAALFLYYIWLLFIFYAKDILQIFHKKEIAEPVFENPSDEMFSVVYRIQDELKEIIRDASIKKITKEEILPVLHNVLKKYALHSTPFQFALNNFIERECKNNCSIHLSEEELSRLW